MNRARQLRYVTELGFDVYSNFYQLPVTWLSWFSCIESYFFRRISFFLQNWAILRITTWAVCYLCMPKVACKNFHRH